MRGGPNKVLHLFTTPDRAPARQKFEKREVGFLKSQSLVRFLAIKTTTQSMLSVHTKTDGFTATQKGFTSEVDCWQERKKKKKWSSKISLCWRGLRYCDEERHRISGRHKKSVRPALLEGECSSQTNTGNLPLRQSSLPLRPPLFISQRPLIV